MWNEDHRSYICSEEDAQSPVCDTGVLILLLVAAAVIALSVYESWQLLHPDKRPIDAFFLQYSA